MHTTVAKSVNVRNGFGTILCWDGVFGRCDEYLNYFRSTDGFISPMSHSQMIPGSRATVCVCGPKYSVFL